jgi:hypothetical protein
MADQSKKEWYQFEELMADLHKGLHPRARIGRHEKILGQNSKTLREIDITIRETVGIQELLIVVDCKKRSRKVDVTGMDAFVGLKEDVGAHAGIIISEKGFSKSALRVAKRNGIQALTFRDTKRHAWAKDLLIPMELDLRVMMPIRVTFEPLGGLETDVAPSDIHITDKATGKPVTLKQLLETQWYEEAEPSPGSWTTVFDAYEEDGRPKGIFRFSFFVEKKRYISKVGLDFIGLIDRQNKLAHLNSVECPEINLKEIERNWAALDDSEAVSAGVLVIVVKTILDARLEGTTVVPNFPDLALKFSFQTKADRPIGLRIGEREPS